VLVARTTGELEETSRQVAALGRQAYAIPADVAEREEVGRAMAGALEQLGKIDVLVNCAGRQPPIGPLWKNDPDDWGRTIEVNLLGTFHCIQAVLPG
jgi:NAD(P)-dependent dehydrogenase (short-subunit alcohol dehydrogenase family)